MLADNFPAKAYLLITYLTETEPSVSSFSSDGTSFEIYDQSIFAQKYLPQYFKHSNYGSFVRQLNLYGFTSSRLKRNNDIVVWTHEFFRQDRKDLVKEIKRTKKSKNAKPSHVNVNARSPSPRSYSSDDYSSNEGIKQPVAISRKDSASRTGFDQGWLESEFFQLKQQNKFLEQKLDKLLQITLRITYVKPLEEVKVGDKRRRMSPVESSSHDYHELGPIYEEQKLFDGDNYGIEPRNSHLLEPASYDEGRKEPPADELDSNHEFGPKDDSLKRFIDIMLTEECQEEKEKAKPLEVNGSEKKVHPPDTDLERDTENSRAVGLPPERVSDDTSLDDALMDEAMDALLPDTDGDLFARPEDFDSEGQLQQGIRPPVIDRAVEKTAPDVIPTEHTTSSEVPPGQVADIEADIEAGNIPVGVAVVSAHAELVEEEHVPNMDLNNNASPLQSELDRHNERRDRRRILYLLAFIGVLLVVLGVTLPVVVVTQNANSKGKKNKSKNSSHSRDDRLPNRPPKPCKNKHDDGVGCPLGSGGPCEDDPTWFGQANTAHTCLWVGEKPQSRCQFAYSADGAVAADACRVTCTTCPEEEEDDDDDDVDGVEQSNSEDPIVELRSSWLEHSQSRRKRISSLLDDVHDGSHSSISVTLDGLNFVCNPNT